MRVFTRAAGPADPSICIVEFNLVYKGFLCLQVTFAFALRLYGSRNRNLVWLSHLVVIGFALYRISFKVVTLIFFFFNFSSLELSVFAR